MSISIEDTHVEPMYDAMGEKQETEVAKRCKDSGFFAWTVCFTSFCVNGTVFGILNTFGILFAAMMEEFNESEDKDLAFKLAWIGSINIGLMHLLSPFSSLIVQVFGIRKTGVIGACIGTTGLFSSSFVTQPELLYLTFGTCIGLGSSLVFMASIEILGHYFDERIGLANGIAWSGGSLYTVCFTFILKYMLKCTGLRWTLRLLACVYATLIICSMTWKSQTQFVTSEKKKKYGSEKEWSCRKNTINKLCNANIWRNKAYIIWVVGMSVGLTGYAVAEVHLIQHSRDKFPRSNAETLIVYTSVTSFVSRLVCGKLADIPKLNCFILLQVTMIALGICNACIPVANTFSTLIIVVLFMGIFDGSFMAMRSLMAFDLLGPELAGQGTGYLFGTGAIPVVLGPPLAGLEYDNTHSYTISFIGAGVILAIGACILFVAMCNKKEAKKYRKPQAPASEQLRCNTDDTLIPS